MTRNTAPHLAEHSRFGQRIRRRYAELLTLLPSGVPTKTGLQAVLQALCARDGDV